MRKLFAGLTFVLLLILASCAAAPAAAPPLSTAANTPSELDIQLRHLLEEHNIGVLDPGPAPDPALVTLGQALFFDKELSGNRDISCATCHHPTLATGDAIALSIGTGGLGLGEDRLRGAMRPLVARNAPEVFNRGAPEWRTMFWDSRVAGVPAGGYSHPREFETALPDGLDNILAAQALFPVAAAAEMRGERGDVDVFGNDNELGDIGDDDLEVIWDGVMARLLAIPAYRDLFAAAYPGLTGDELGIEQAANALAAFQIGAFTLLDSPWDRYLSGEDTALGEQAKRGGLLFYGKARCAVCHGGALFTDQAPHNIAVPQVGPGKGREAPNTDLGRFRETEDPQDRYAFRTPPLRNVAETGPWMHNGAYASLEAAIRHHLDPAAALANYDLRQLPPGVRQDTEWREATLTEMLSTLDPDLEAPLDLSDEEIEGLLAFLLALTDPAIAGLGAVIPERVPSGLPIADGPAGPTPFANATASAGIDAIHSKGYQVTGQAWGDYDNDGWLDLYLTDSRGPNTLYRNAGNGAFTISPLSDQIALPDHYSGGAIFADYDNDGWADLYVLGRGANILYHNDAGQGFSDVTAEAGVGDASAGKTASWGDYDNDGYLDLYVANWSCSPRCPRPVEGDRDTLYHNNGDGAFSDVTGLLGQHTRGAGFVAAWVDFDNDGDLDIYVVNDEFINPIGNKLWRNDGPGCESWCFTEIAADSGADTRVMGMGLATDDFNQDGLLDFYFSNAGEMVLLENRGGDGFGDIAPLAGVSLDDSAIGWGTVSLDYDNDGLRDLYLALMEQNTAISPYNPLFHNNGDGTFTDLGIESGAADPGPSMGVAYADYDNDGWVDLVVGNYDRGYELYHNQALAAPEHGWLTLKLVGAGPVNRDAVGARVWVTTEDGRTQMQEVRSGAGLGGGSTLRLHFGLSEAELAGVVVRWPDGTEQVLDDLQPNRAYVIPYDGVLQELGSVQ